MKLTYSAASRTIVNVPETNGPIWRRCRAKLQLTSDQAAKALGIKGGSLRQIETSTKPASLALGYRAEKLYGDCDVLDHPITIDDLLVLSEDEGEPGEVPAPDKKEPKPKTEPIGPPGRRDGKDDRRGPRRVRGAT